MAFESIETCPFESDINACHKTNRCGRIRRKTHPFGELDVQSTESRPSHTTNDFVDYFRPLTSLERCNASSVVPVKNNTPSGKRDNGVLCSERVVSIYRTHPTMFYIDFETLNLSFRECSVTHRFLEKGHDLVIIFFFHINLSAEKYE